MQLTESELRKVKQLFTHNAAVSDYLFEESGSVQLGVGIINRLAYYRYCVQYDQVIYGGEPLYHAYRHRAFIETLRLFCIENAGLIKSDKAVATVVANLFLSISQNIQRVVKYYPNHMTIDGNILLIPPPRRPII